MDMRLIGTALAALLSCTASAMPQSPSRAAGACLQDARELCRGVPPGGGRIVACLQANRAHVSDTCAATLGLGSGRAGATGPDQRSGAEKVLKDVSYGSDPAQRLDVYLPASANGTVIVMLHGGAWAFGDKANRQVVGGKLRHWVSQGAILASVNTRLRPRADPLEQANDLAAAMATVQRRAAEWGGSADRIVLMGHSSGAHVAALLTVDSSIGRASGLRPWRGTVAIDSAAYDVPAIMKAPHPPLYDRAFGSDEKLWQAASPLQRINGTPSPMLLICSTFRRTSCGQAEAFARALKGRASVVPVAKSHGELNAALGLDATYTAAVDAFLKRVSAR